MLLEARVASRQGPSTIKKHMESVQPAPVGGWVSNASIAKENPLAAEVMENFFPTERGVRARGGSLLFASVGLAPIESLMVYKSGLTEKLFASMAGGIYDVSNPASPTATITPAVTGLTSNEYSYINYATGGGEFLFAVNGTDLHRVYNGTAWAANVPAITGVSTANISQVWVHAERIWLVEKGKKVAWYLPVDTLGGAALDFSLQGVFREGGALLFGATWSQDSGDGSDDRCVFVSDQGEVAVYGGDYPGGTTWNKFGRYDIAKPLGKNAFHKVGGDLLIMTVSGIVALSEVISKDPAALNVTAITKYIEPDWKRYALAHSDKPWTFVKWDEKNIGFVSVPSDTTTVTGPSSLWNTTFTWGSSVWGLSGATITTPVGTPQILAVNLQTGRWSKITGWDARSMAVFKGEFVFGTNSGSVHYGDTSGSDNGISYECRMAYWPSRFDYAGEKQFLQVASVFEHSTPFLARVSITTNNRLTWSVAPPAPAEADGGALWDVSVWDGQGVVWDAEGEKRVTYKKWASLTGRGRVGALMVQMLFNNQTTPDVEYTDSLVTYETVGIVT